ncbi:MAG: PEP/pyruvate-binding domain-containing protein [Thermodesulfobacteriota bacterium]
MALIDFFKRETTCRLLSRLDGPLVEKYRHFREFLRLNRDALNLMAELEQTYYSGSGFSETAVRNKAEALLETTRSLIETINTISGDKYRQLQGTCETIGQSIQAVFTPEPPAADGPMTLPLDALAPEMLPMAGAKATHLATMRNTIGLRVPHGFVITAHAFQRFLGESGLTPIIADKLAQLEKSPQADLEGISKDIRALVREAPLPNPIAEAIMEAYRDLEGKTRPGVRVAMRSSAVGEDSEASFAGQYTTVLNVSHATLLDAYKEVVASKYSPRAILYRRQFGFADEETPMCVAGIEMIDARVSGVLYTVDPARPNADEMKISAILGLGEHLVSGESSPDEYFLDRGTGQIVQRELRPKTTRLVAGENGGTRLEEVSAPERLEPSIDDTTVLALAEAGKRAEEHFQSPQDMEWAMDQKQRLFFLQSRPLGVVREDEGEAGLAAILAAHAIRLQGGVSACPGIATGRVFLSDGGNLSALPEDAILVARTASPDYAEVAGKVRGIITDVGSVASHLASVAREFRVPALFDAKEATSILHHGEAITLVSQQMTVYHGIAEGLPAHIKAGGGLIINSPVHQRLRAVLDLTSPLNLLEPDAANFSPEGCQTIHDIIRFAHERIMKEIFFLSEETAGAPSVRLQANIPLVLHCIDLGGGLRDNLTTCDEVTPNHLTSIPMKAMWGGFMHPGITWAGTINLDMNNFFTLMSSTAVSEFGPQPGGDSYAVISREYMNLSAKFGYHYANVDAFCAVGEENAGQNHILLQFSGGVGSFVGRSLRIQFLANVLGRLGFHLTITGDLLEASLKNAGQKIMEEALDQLGRLLASSRLLDMAIANPDQVEAMTEAFFRGDYDFLGQGVTNSLPGYYTPLGNWRAEEDTLLVQDGSRWLTSLGAGFAGFMGRVAGAKYQEFLDNIGAYYHFPLAIAKESGTGDAVLSVQVQPAGGHIDQAGGLAFGLRNVGNYFVLRINALENNCILFEFVNNRRYTRATAAVEVRTGQWYTVRVKICGNHITGSLDGATLLEYEAAWPVHGHVGLWTKADSLTRFRNLHRKEFAGR